MGLLYHLNFLFLVEFYIVGLTYTEDVIKCINMPSEKLRISCPQNHVIYNPVIMAGVSPSQSCDPTPHDCIGISQNIKRQTDKCFWKKRCTIKLKDTDSVTSCRNNVDAAIGNITYVIIKQTYCIPKDIILDICTDVPKTFDFRMGVIRSHRKYPRKMLRQEVCNVTIPLASGNSLIMENSLQSGRLPFGLTLRALPRNGRQPREITSFKKLTLPGTSTAAVVVEINCPSRRKTEGFMIPFVAYNSKRLDETLSWPNSSHPIMKELDKIIEVRPVIEQCAVGVSGQMRLVCDRDEVIYKPAVSMSGYTRRTPKCIFSRNRKYPCGGYTPELLVQRNSCFWKNSCVIAWREEDRIIISKDAKCVGFSTSSIGLSGHRCVRKENIYDLCTSSTSVIDNSWGIIRSHPEYPWYFDTSVAECKRIIYINGDHALMLSVQDMNLDPDGRDKFSVYHVKKNNEREEIMNAKTKEGDEIVAKGGRIVIKFTRSKASKGGRGFILVFRRFSIPRRNAIAGPVNTQTTPHDKALNDDASRTKRRMTNLRLCSKRKTRKGRPCHRLVWTDYFTRLE